MRRDGLVAATPIFLSIFSALAMAQHHRPLPHPIGAPQAQGGAQANGPAVAASSSSPWTPLENQPGFLLDGAANPILLTDGSVLVQDAGFPDWWKLTPDKTGSYVHGTWTQIASLPASYSPLYHSSAVLPDGRLIIEGGEYLLNAAQTQLVVTDSNQGSIYDPLANTWSAVPPPSGWTTIGDAQNVVLEDGTYMQADCCSERQARLNARTLQWTSTGANKFDPNDEEGWTLLPDGQVLAVDAYVPIPPFPYIPDGMNSEVYSVRTGAWQSAGSTLVQLWDSAADCGGEKVAAFELGPGVLRPDGTVFYTGANSCGGANTAIYDTHRRSWRPGPRFPDGLDIADGPAALEPNGKVLMMASPGIYQTPTTFLEWDGSTLKPVAGTPNAAGDSSYYGNMLVLPTGQILLTDFSNDIEIYTPSPSYHPEWAPQILVAPVFLTGGRTYQVYGFRFGGMSQGAAYGDDAQAATNFPLVRITNLETGDVYYSRTHNPSSMAVAYEGLVSTNFDVPGGQKKGMSRMEVVTNGIASSPHYVYVY